MLAGSLPRLAAALMQPTVLAAGVATGVGLGAVGVATGAIPVKDPGPPRTALYECPGAGRIVTSILTDQTVLVTARSADGGWLQIYVGEPAVDRGWARATSLQLRAAPDSLPIVDCTPGTPGVPRPTAPPPSIAPGEATDSPSSPLGPMFSNYYVGALDSPRDPQTGHVLVGTFSNGCWGDFIATVGVTVTGPDGIVSVSLGYLTADGRSGTVAMEHPVGAPDGSQDWYGNIEVEDDWAYGVIRYWVSATDVNGATWVANNPASETLELAGC